MTPDNQRAALAKFCGWKVRIQSGLYESQWFVWDKGIETAQLWQLPDYLNDLNAIRLAEDIIFDAPETIEGDRMRKLYRSNLESIVMKTWGDRLFRATASQRAEAVLKTIGEWK